MGEAEVAVLESAAGGGLRVGHGELWWSGYRMWDFFE